MQLKLLYLDGLPQFQSYVQTFSWLTNCIQASRREGEECFPTPNRFWWYWLGSAEDCFFLANSWAFPTLPFPTCCIPTHPLLAFICSWFSLIPQTTAVQRPLLAAYIFFYSESWLTSLLLASKETYQLFFLTGEIPDDPQGFNSAEEVGLVSM